MTSGKDKGWKKNMNYTDFEPEPKKDKSLKDFIKEDIGKE